MNTPDEDSVTHFGSARRRLSPTHIMESGQLRFSGLARELRAKPELLRSAYLLRGSSTVGNSTVGNSTVGRPTPGGS